jgi:hypothetical protein
MVSKSSLNEFDLIITPNPTKSNFSFIVTDNEINGEYFMNIYSSEGKIVFSKYVKENEIIETNFIKKGIYILKVKTPRGFVNQKLVNM